MRGAILATAAAFAGTAVADVHMRRHAHEGLHHRGLHHSSSAIPPKPEESCGCTTEVISYWGEPTLVPVEVPTSTVTSETTSTVESTSYTTITVTATSETPEVTLPTPGVTSFTETGTYTIPATTITVTDTTTVCGATTTDLPSGTHTYGGVTTIVETATTITCPYATVKPSGSTVTSVIETTTYVCPSAGTYTINPTTTYVPTSTVVVYPTPATVTPGTYTNPESTITVTRTDYTYVCPYTNVDEPTAVPTSTSAPTSTVVPTTTAVPSSTTSTSVPVASGGPAMGMTFTPYETNGDCMSKANVLEQVGIIKQKGFTHVRVYGTDCHTLEYVGAACKTHGLKLILGVFIDGNGINDAVNTQVDEIASWAQWDIVSLISAGNEAITNGYVQPAALASFVSSAKAKWEAAGYTGQVTVAEAINAWLSNGATLCPVVDVLGANLHPFFNAEFSASQAGELVSNQIKDLKEVCSGKDVINLETGWPNAGLSNGLAIPSPSEQAIAIKSLVEKVGGVSVFFSYSDDAWKQKFESSDQFKVEPHWGCIDQF